MEHLLFSNGFAHILDVIRLPVFINVISSII